MKRIYAFIATLGPIGYLAGSGTLATVFTLIPSYWLSELHISYVAHLLVLCCIAVGCFYIINRVSATFTDHDPLEIVLIPSCGIVCAVRKSWVACCIHCSTLDPHIYYEDLCHE